MEDWSFDISMFFNFLFFLFVGLQDPSLYSCVSNKHNAEILTNLNDKRLCLACSQARTRNKHFLCFFVTWYLRYIVKPAFFSFFSKYMKGKKTLYLKGNKHFFFCLQRTQNTKFHVIVFLSFQTVIQVCFHFTILKPYRT